MTNIAQRVGWLCTAPCMAEAATNVLEESRDEASAQFDSTEVFLGRIGPLEVIVACARSQLELGGAVIMAHRMFNNYPKLQAIFIMSSLAECPLDTHLGDLLINIVSNVDAKSDELPALPIAERAIDVLRKEVGDCGSWIPSNIPEGELDESKTNQSLSDTSHSMCLHYLQNLESIKCVETSDTVNSHLKSIETTTVFVFAVAGINQSSSKEYNTPIRNAASYIKEVVQLMADPSTINMPFLNGTEKLVPAWPIPNIPPFPSHQYPTSGNEILLVIPTENKQKILLLQEFVIDRAPEGVAVQSVTVPVESGVGEQPYNEAGLKGAYNRINNALNRLHSEEFKNLFINKHIGTVIVASIESFIQTENIDRPSDFGVIVIHNATTQKTESCLSEGVTVSPKYVSRAQRFGCDGDPNYGKVTVGQIMAARVPTLDKANWQAVLANCSRYELLKNAIKEIPVPW